MSGLISSAGSRSGIIGTTELDYEEGTWTPGLSTGNESGTWSSCLGKYIKVGNQVTIWWKISGSGMYLADEHKYKLIINSPFIAESGDAGPPYAGSWTADTVAHGNGGIIYASGDIFYLHAGTSSPTTSGVSVISCCVNIIV